ncbi:MAG: aldo/keto reductase [Cyclobacteriaceae bacterium]
MIYRQVGNSDLELSAIILGTWAIGGWMWGHTPENEAVKAIRSAIDHGVNTIDTAPLYGRGRSEVIVGKAVKSMSRDKIRLLTKFGVLWNSNKAQTAYSISDENGKKVNISYHSGKESIIRECEESLRRMDTEYIDLYQMHFYDPNTPMDDTFEAVNKLVEQGKVRHVGVCNLMMEDLNNARQLSDIQSIQVPYNMLNRMIEDELVPLCQEKNTGILAYSPLARGLLTGKIKPGHKFNTGDHRAEDQYFSDSAIKNIEDTLDQIRIMADEKGVTSAQLVLRWTLEQPGISAVLAGARNPSQAKENAMALDFAFDSSDADRLNEFLKQE